AVALEAARAAGETALRRFRVAIAVETKADGTPVTAADRAAERAARAVIERHFPADGILGEEDGLVRPDSPRRWIVDPIDGTKSFVRGVPLWGSLVALVERGHVIAGAAHYAALGESVSAARGEGCWSGNHRCAVSAVRGLARATVLTTDVTFARKPARREDWWRLADRAALARSWGDCYGYLLVATGRAEVMVDPVMAPWDVAAVSVIVEEAGGVFTDWEGHPSGLGTSAIATNRGVAAAARAALGCRWTGRRGARARAR
ncbi:MAG TPA: inositol monophosphatase family protein, partial [Candidatus Eisenbacteria bacterium]